MGSTTSTATGQTVTAVVVVWALVAAELADGAVVAAGEADVACSTAAGTAVAAA